MGEVMEVMGTLNFAGSKKSNKKSNFVASHLMGTQTAVWADLAGASIVQLKIIVTF